MIRIELSLFLLMSAEFTQILRGETVYFQLTIVSAVAFITCGLYLLKSKRVKETFVQTLRKKYVKLTIEE